MINFKMSNSALPAFHRKGLLTFLLHKHHLECRSVKCLLPTMFFLADCCGEPGLCSLCPISAREHQVWRGGLR